MKKIILLTFIGSSDITDAYILIYIILSILQVFKHRRGKNRVQKRVPNQKT